MRQDHPRRTIRQEVQAEGDHPRLGPALHPQILPLGGIGRVGRVPATHGPASPHGADETSHRDVLHRSEHNLPGLRTGRFPDQSKGIRTTHLSRHATDGNPRSEIRPSLLRRMLVADRGRRRGDETAQVFQQIFGPPLRRVADRSGRLSPLVEKFQSERGRAGRDQVHVARVDPCRAERVLDIPRDQEVFPRMRLREGPLFEIHERVPVRVQEQAKLQFPVVLSRVLVPRGRDDEERPCTRSSRNGSIQGTLVLDLSKPHGRVRAGSGGIPSTGKRQASPGRASTSVDGDDRSGASVLGETVAGERVVLGHVRGPSARPENRARKIGRGRVVQGQRVPVLLERVPRQIHGEARKVRGLRHQLHPHFGADRPEDVAEPRLPGTDGRFVDNRRCKPGLHKQAEIPRFVPLRDRRHLHRHLLEGEERARLEGDRVVQAGQRKDLRLREDIETRQPDDEASVEPFPRRERAQEEAAQLHVEPIVRDNSRSETRHELRLLLSDVAYANIGRLRRERRVEYKYQ